MDRFSKYNRIANSLRGRVCELELVTTLKLPDGTTQEVTDLRRVLCKKVSRKRNSTVLEFSDIDLSALDKVFPFETFTVADFPELYVADVGKRVPQGVGTVTKVPAAWVVKSGGTWVYAGPSVIAAYGVGTVLAVYRGTQPGKGAVIDPSEYTIGTMIAPSGLQVHTINFTREQVDYQGRPYVIEADWSLPGSRSPSDEIARILALYGQGVDAASFTTAATSDNGGGYLVDALYGDPGRAGRAILADLLQVARGWIRQTSDGKWAIVQDNPQAASLDFDTSADPVEITEYGDGDIPASATLDYRPNASGTDGDYTGHLEYPVSTSTGQRQMKSPYIYSHDTADRVLGYWQRRLKTLRIAKAKICAMQLTNGAVISITDNVWWTGTKTFIVTGINRPADANQVTLREYDASLYDHVAKAPPPDPTNGYQTDYSYTKPAAPSYGAIASQGTSADTDGKVRSYAFVQALPPAVNWAQLRCLLTDTTTNEEYPAELRFNAVSGYYEATVSGLRPGRVHSLTVWAVNSNLVEGFALNPGNFTSATYTNALAAPVVTVTQKQSFELNIDLSAVADVAGAPKFRRYVLFEKVGAGSFTEVQRTPDRTLKRSVNHGTAYAYIAHSEDQIGNESVDSNTATFTPSAVVNDNWLVNQGVSGVSIANNSINRGRSYTGTGSTSVTIIAGSSQGVDMDVYSFFPDLDHGGNSVAAHVTSAGTKIGQADQGRFRLHNMDAGFSTSVTVTWRSFIA